MPRHSMAEMAKLRFHARGILKAISNDNRVPIRDIVGRYNDRTLVALRVEFMKRCAALDMGPVTIARIVGRDASTVQYHLGGWRERKYAAARARWEARHGR